MAITLIHGDCIKFADEQRKSSINMIITSPPYNLNIRYNQYKDNKKMKEYLEWLSCVFKSWINPLKDNGSIFLNVGSSNRNPWVAMDVAQVARKYFILQNEFVWIKSISISDTTHGHFKPINSKRYTNNTHEKVFHFTKTGNVEIHREDIGVPYMDKSNIKRWNKNKDLRCRGNCWYIPYKTISSKKQKGNHPATFPIELAVQCIKLHGYNKRTQIYDPFVGTGTTLIAAQKLNINATGTDIDQNYIKYAKKWIEDEEDLFNNN